jgi:low affinity Fe/Cu permease
LSVAETAELAVHPMTRSSSRKSRNHNGFAERSSELFARFAHQAARLAGKPGVFLGAVALIVVWAFSGPLFGFSDTWQLVINTTTTIVTFLMVFLIQNTQNRDSLALQIKLAELIFVMKDTPNRLAVIEDLSDEELERLHKEFEAYAARAFDELRPGRKRPRPNHGRRRNRSAAR